MHFCNDVLRSRAEFRLPGGTRVIDFNWNDLRYFLQLVRSGTPAKAAQAMHADHTTVRRRVAALEEALGTTLLIPGEDGYQCTPNGESLLRCAEEMERLTLSTEAEISNQFSSLSGTVRVAAPEGFGSLFFAPRLHRFFDTHPNLHIHLVTMPRAGNLNKREADIVIWISMPDQQRQVTRKLTEYSLGLYAADSYLEKNQPITTVQDLKQHRLIAYLQDLLLAQEIEYFSQIGEPVMPQFEATSLVALMQATMAGAGVSVLPHWVAQTQPILRPVLADLFHLKRSVWLSIHPDLRSLAAVRVVADFIVDEVRSAQANFLP